MAIVEVEGNYHVVGIDHQRGQIKSVCSSDMPDSGVWVARFSDEGVKYVSKGRTNASALKLFKKYSNLADY